MKTIPVLLLMALSTTADAKPIRAQTLRESVIAALKEDRQVAIVSVELYDSNPDFGESAARLRLRINTDEQRIKELGGTFEPWVWRSSMAHIQVGCGVSAPCSGVTQDPAAAKIWRDGAPYPSSVSREKAK